MPKTRANVRRKQAIKRDAMSESANWRRAPVTQAQRKVLDRIMSESGRPVAVSITRGEASDLIGRRFDEDREARSAARRAHRARRRAARRAG